MGFYFASFFRNISEMAEIILIKKIGRNHGISIYKNVLISDHRKNYIFRDNNCFVKMSVSLLVSLCRGLQSRKVGSRLIWSPAGSRTDPQNRELVDKCLKVQRTNLTACSPLNWPSKFCVEANHNWCYLFFKIIFPKKEDWLNYLKYFYNYFQIWC